MKKLFILFLASIFLGSLTIPLLTFAQAKDAPGYQMLAPITELQNPATGKADIATFIPAAVKLTISIAAALAVIMIIVGGFKYIAAEAFQSKSNAKETIQNAVIGLLLALASYSILYTINPKLVEFSLKLDYQGSSEPIPTDLGRFSTGSEAADGPADQVPLPSPKAGTPWYPDDNIRLGLEKAGIGVKKPSCLKVGDSGCTSVYGLSSTVRDNLIALKAICSCQITITGGTEYWLHGNPRTTDLSKTNTRHQPGGLVVDLRISDTVTTYLRSGARNVRDVSNDSADKNPRCAPGNERYRVGSLGLFVNETISGNDPHWHVCFY